MIIISGDSFSTPDLEVLNELGESKPAPWKIWADQLPFDDKIINVSVSGIGNDLIIRNAIDALLKYSNVNRVIIALSQWVRFSIRGRFFNPQIFNGVRDSAKDTLYSKRETNICRKDIKTIETLTGSEEPEIKAMFHTPLAIETMIDDTLRDIYILQQLCKQRGVRLHVFQMLQPLAGFDDSAKKAVAKKMLSRDYFDIIESLNDIDLIGWPFTSILGGYFFDQSLISIDRVGNGDAHPNKQGHIKLAEMFNGTFKEYKI